MELRLYLKYGSRGTTILGCGRRARGRRALHCARRGKAHCILELQAAIHRQLEPGMNYWEIIARNIKKRGWSLGWVSAIDSNGRTIWIADAHRGDGKRFVVRAATERQRDARAAIPSIGP